jgi:hypothetical protein
MIHEEIGPVRLIAIVQNQGSAYYLEDGALIQVPIQDGEIRVADLTSKRDLRYGPVEWDMAFADGKERGPVKAIEEFLLSVEGAPRQAGSPEAKEGTRSVEFETECTALLIERWRVTDVPADLQGKDLVLDIESALRRAECDLLSERGKNEGERRLRVHSIEVLPRQG